MKVLWFLSSHFEVLEKAGATPEQLANLFQKMQGEQSTIAIRLLERLLGHNATELYSKVLGQGREPIVVALNRGENGYIPANHWATFANCLELGNFSAYITNYIATLDQIERFDNSSGTNYTYENLLGDSITTTGRLFGAEPTPSPTPSPTTLTPTTKTMDQEL